MKLLGDFMAPDCPTLVGHNIWGDKFPDDQLPEDWGCLDAPTTIPAGAVHRYECVSGDWFFPTQRTFDR